MSRDGCNIAQFFFVRDGWILACTRRDNNICADLAAKEALQTDKNFTFDVCNLYAILAGLCLLLMAEEANFGSPCKLFASAFFELLMQLLLPKKKENHAKQMSKVSFFRN